MSENLYTEAEVARLQGSEVNLVLKGLLRTLEEVKGQRSMPHQPGTHQRYLERQRGEINGLNIAIAAVNRRIKEEKEGS